MVKEISLINLENISTFKYAYIFFVHKKGFLFRGQKLAFPLTGGLKIGNFSLVNFIVIVIKITITQKEFKKFNKKMNVYEKILIDCVTKKKFPNFCSGCCLIFVWRQYYMLSVCLLFCVWR